MQLEVIFQTTDFVVVAKPEKLLVHRTSIATEDKVFALQIARAQFGRRLWPVHRLDRGSSGLLIFAFSAEACAALQAALASQSAQKTYLAIVRGAVSGSLLIDHALRQVEDPYERVHKTNVQSAQTWIEPVACAALPIAYGAFDKTRLTLLRAALLTGRRHQIRRHLKHIAHPIIGDATYGKGPLNRQMAQFFGGERLYLHCCGMKFSAFGQTFELVCPPTGLFALTLQEAFGIQIGARDMDFFLSCPPYNAVVDVDK